MEEYPIGEYPIGECPIGEYPLEGYPREEYPIRERSLSRGRLSHGAPLSETAPKCIQEGNSRALPQILLGSKSLASSKTKW